MLNEYVAERASAYRIPGRTVFGNDPLIVYEAMREAVDRARRGDGPTLLECLTYRHGGHKRDDPATYRDREEVAAWLGCDPIPNFRNRLLADERFDEATITAIEEEVASRLHDCVDYARRSPFPATDSALEYIYA
jgi:pyruvate dehydrogenase E1 component alpha subunit